MKKTIVIISTLSIPILGIYYLLTAFNIRFEFNSYCGHYSSSNYVDRYGEEGQKCNLNLNIFKKEGEYEAIFENEWKPVLF